MLLVAEFGVLVQVTAPGGDLVREFGDAVDDGHVDAAFLTGKAAHEAKAVVGSMVLAGLRPVGDGCKSIAPGVIRLNRRAAVPDRQPQPAGRPSIEAALAALPAALTVQELKAEASKLCRTFLAEERTLARTALEMGGSGFAAPRR